MGHAVHHLEHRLHELRALVDDELPEPVLAELVVEQIGVALAGAEHGRPRDVAHARQRPAESFDQHLLLVEHGVHRERDALVARAEDDDGRAGGEGRRGVARGRREPEHVGQPHAREGAAAERDGLAAFHRAHGLGLHARHALDLGGGRDEHPALGLDQDAPEGRAHRRQHDAETRAPAGLGFNRDGAAQFFGLLAHDRQAQPAAGEPCDDGAGGNLGLENQRERLRLAHPERVVRREQAVLDRRLLDPDGVDPGAVVGHEHLHPAVVQPGDGERDDGARGLAQPEARLGRFDAVIDAVAQQVDERVLHLLQDALVDLDVLAADGQLRVLALVAAKVAHQFGKRGGDGGEGQQKQFFGVLQQVVHELADDVVVPPRGAGERGHVVFQRPEVLVIPFDELEQPGEAGGSGARRSVGLFLRLAQGAGLRLHRRPLVFPDVETAGQFAQIRRALARGQLGREHLLRLDQPRVELGDGDAHGVLAGGRRGLLGQGGRRLRPRSDQGREGGGGPGRGQRGGDGVERAMRRVEGGGRRRVRLAFPRGKHVLQGLAQGLDRGEVHRARRALQAVRRAKHGLDEIAPRVGRGRFLQL